VKSRKVKSEIILANLLGVKQTHIDDSFTFQIFLNFLREKNFLEIFLQKIERENF